MEIQVKSTLPKFRRCKMTEKAHRTLIKSQGLSSHITIRNGRSTSHKSYETSIFRQKLKIFNAMALHVQWMSLIHEKLNFLYHSELGALYDLINV